MDKSGGIDHIFLKNMFLLNLEIERKKQGERNRKFDERDPRIGCPLQAPYWKLRRKLGLVT